MLQGRACLLDISNKGPYVLFTTLVGGRTAANFKGLNADLQAVQDYLDLAKAQGRAVDGFEPNATIIEAVNAVAGGVFIRTRVDFLLSEGTTFDQEVVRARNLAFLLQQEPEAFWLDERFPGSGVSNVVR